MAESQSEIVLKGNTHTQTEREKLGSGGWGCGDRKRERGRKIRKGEREIVYMIEKNRNTGIEQKPPTVPAGSDSPC